MSFTITKADPTAKVIGPARIIRIDKECACCGKRYLRVPAQAKENEMGIWWNCACHTTMFYKPLVQLEVL